MPGEKIMVGKLNKILIPLLMLLIPLSVFVSSAAAVLVCDEETGECYETTTTTTTTTIVSISNAEAVINNEINVTIMAEQVTNLAAATIELSYNSTIVNVTKVFNGELANNPIEFITNISNVTGKTTIIAFNTATPKSGNVVIANVTLNATKRGPSPLTLSVPILADQFGNAIPYTIKSGTFKSLTFPKRDANGDYVIDPISDATVVMEYAAGIRVLDEDHFEAADVNNDGKVNVLDALLIAQNNNIPPSTTTPTTAEIPTSVVKISTAVNTTNNIIPITVENVANLAAATIELSYNSKIVNVTKVSAGDLGTVIANISNTTNKTSITAISSTPKSGNVTIANITLKPGTIGLTQLDLSVQQLLDHSGKAINYNINNGSFNNTKLAKGDINGDGILDIKDVLAIMDHIVNNKVLNGDQIIAADVNNDTKVDVEDALSIARIAQNTPVSTPITQTSTPVVKISNAVNTTNNIIPITVENVAYLAAATIELSYNSKIVNVTKVSAGDLETVSANISNTTNKTSIAAISKTPKSGNVIIANITLKPGTIGLTQLDLSVLQLLDQNGEAIINYNIKSGSFDNTELAKGDMNGDGKVDIIDAMIIMQYTVGTTNLADYQIEAADIDGDGKVNVVDAYLIARYTVGKYTL